MSDALFDALTPAARSAAAPYYPMIREVAAAHGVNPSLALAIAQRESGFRPDVLNGSLKGDQGQSVGMWQVKTKYLKDWGFDPQNDTRGDPDASTRAIMPVLRRIQDDAGGDPALTQAIYMRGASSPQVRALRAGAAPADAFANDPIGLAQYNRFATLKSRGLFSKPTKAAETPAPSPVPAVAPRENDTTLPPNRALTALLGIDTPPPAIATPDLYASAPAPARGVAIDAYHAARRAAQEEAAKINHIYTQLGIDKSWLQNLG